MLSAVVLKIINERLIPKHKMSNSNTRCQKEAHTKIFLDDHSE